MPELATDRDSPFPDYSLVPDLHAYLVDRKLFESHTIEPLSGGSANFTFRLDLKSPFEGRPSLVLKHSKDYVATAKSIPFGLERQSFEVEALKRVRAWLPKDSMVSVPAVHLYDEDAHIIIMDDCGPAAATLKTLMLAGKITLPLAREIGSALGIFLSTLHDQSTQYPSTVQFFDANTQGKNISAWAVYGRLISTISGKDNLTRLSGLEVSGGKLDILSKVADHMTGAITSAVTATSPLVMGDFWPGNIMVTFDVDNVLQRIDVLDWELAKPGLRGVEIGQFCGEMHQTRLCYPQYAESASRTVAALLSTYAQGHKSDTAVARDVLVHCGAHMVVWTPRVPWGDNATTKKVVEEGIKFLVDGFTGTAGALKESWVAEFEV